MAARLGVLGTTSRRHSFITQLPRIPFLTKSVPDSRRVAPSASIAAGMTAKLHFAIGIQWERSSMDILHLIRLILTSCMEPVGLRSRGFTGARASEKV